MTHFIIGFISSALISGFVCWQIGLTRGYRKCWRQHVNLHEWR